MNHMNNSSDSILQSNWMFNKFGGGLLSQSAGKYFTQMAQIHSTSCLRILFLYVQRLDQLTREIIAWYVPPCERYTVRPHVSKNCESLN